MPVCQLCRRSRPLVNAHIVPRGFYPKLSKGEPHYLLTDDGKRPARNWTGLYDQTLLCAECDNMLGVFDQYACELLLPWPKREELLREFSGYIAKGGDETKFAGYRLFPDVRKMQLFSASLLWRAAKSNREEFRIAPASTFLAKAEALLRTEDSKFYLGVAARRLDNLELTRFVARPVRTEGDWGEGYEFCMSGVLLHIIENIPSTGAPIMLGASSEWWVTFERFWGSDVERALRDMKESADKIPKRGQKDG